STPTPNPSCSKPATTSLPPEVFACGTAGPGRPLSSITIPGDTMKPISSIAAKLAVCALPVLAASATAVQAADFPDRPVTLVTWSPAGGPIDTLARLIGTGLSERWGQTV